jgi:hypothetical protein
MKNRRLYAIVLLAALALLQARAAFAGCLDPERTVTQAAAGCCLEHALPERALPQLDEAGMVCVSHCLQSSNSANEPDIHVLVASELAVPSSPPLLRSAHYPPSSASLRLFVSAASHPAHTPLVYVLQRLLI